MKLKIGMQVVVNHLINRYPRLDNLTPQLGRWFLPPIVPRTITGLHQRGDAALGQSRAAGRARGIEPAQLRIENS